MEFRETAYSVIEDEMVYNVTVIKQGDPGQEFVVSILPRFETGIGIARRELLAII